MAPEDLRQHVAEAQALAERLWEQWEESTEMSGRADENLRPRLRATNEDISVSCNPSPDRDCFEEQEAAGGALDKADLLASLTP